MIPDTKKNFRFMLLATGAAAGIIIAMVDNFAFSGEVSPIVIVAMLLAATGTSGIIWRWQGWLVAVAAWLFDPLVHFIKHILGLPDTLHPNTYLSILMLAVFTFVVSAFGLGFGVLVRKITNVNLS